MRRILTYGGPLLATCLALTGLSSAYADTTTVTTKTTTVATAPSVLLPSSTYAIVDPLTGTIKGDYVVGTRVIDGVPLSSNYVVMDKVTRRLVGTFDASGNLVDLAAVPAASSVVVSLDSHRIALEKQIDALVADGQISAGQAADMRLEIARLFPAANQTVTTRTFTYDSALAADSGLYTVESQLVPLVKRTYTTTLIAPKFIAVNGQLILPDSISYRKMHLERKIEDQFAFGHLTSKQLISLKSDITDISNREARFRVRDGGGLNAADAAKINADLDSLQARMNRDVASVDAGHPL